MATYAFINIPAYGHVNYTLPLVQELVARGQQVTYYLSRDFKQMVEAAGANFYAYDTAEGAEEAIMRRVSQVMEGLQAAPPDYIVYDYMSTWVPLLARALHIPAISIRCTYAMNEHFSWSSMNHYTSETWSKTEVTFGFYGVEEFMQRQIEKLCEMVDVPASALPASPLDMYAYHEMLNICFIPRCFQPFADTFDDSFLFVGPSILPRPYRGDFQLDKLDDRPLLYIALGTIFNERPDILKMCVKALGNTSWQVVLSRGQKTIRSALGPIPSNILVAKSVPQLEILPRTNIFISHAGISSVMETLYYGVPMIAIPQIPEHAIAADCLQRLGLGIALNPDKITIAALSEAVTKIAHEPMYYEQARAMAQHVREAGGYKRAADALLESQHQHQAASLLMR